jgi:toxin YoeB
VTLVFSDDAWEDYLYWQETEPQTLKRIHQLIKKSCVIHIAGSANQSR